MYCDKVAPLLPCFKSEINKFILHFSMFGDIFFHAAIRENIVKELVFYFKKNKT